MTDPRVRAHLSLALLGAAIVVLSAVLVPSDESVSLFGHVVPQVCFYQRFLGVSCPGCGLTRSFTYMAHGHALDAFRMHKLGPVLFVGVAGLVPYNLALIWRLRRAAPAPREATSA